MKRKRTLRERLRLMAYKVALCHPYKHSTPTLMLLISFNGILFGVIMSGAIIMVLPLIFSRNIIHPELRPVPTPKRVSTTATGFEQLSDLWSTAE